MKSSGNYKKSIGLVLLTIVAGCSTTPLSWTHPTVVNTFIKTFMEGCNPKNEFRTQIICECVIDKIKVKYPDASKAESIPDTEFVAAAKECKN